MTSAPDPASPEGPGIRPVRFHNTLTRELERFEPLVPGRVRLYTCGPTVYNAPHIGNLRTFLFEDLLRRSLEFLGYEVTQVMNLTDVEDKIIDGAHAAGMTIPEFTEPHIQTFFAALDSLGFKPADHYPRATEHIAGMIELIEALLQRGHAYQAEGGVFFRIASYAAYGKLSRIDLSQCRQGERVADDEYGKDDVRDFVLWKSAKPGEPSWPSPWGPGRPGWHIECSAMSKHFLGETFDIHCGGVDNIFPHHENEIAQSECAHGAPFVHYWLHSEHLMIDGEKMSKSKGNMYRLDDLEKLGVSARALRYLFLSVHYRRKINYTASSLDAATAALRRLDEFRSRVLRSQPPMESAQAPIADRPSDVETACAALLEDFGAALAEDLNASEALAALFRFVKEINRAIDEVGLDDAQRRAVLATLERVDGVLGVLDAEAWASKLDQPGQAQQGGLSDDRIEALVEARSAARQDKRWQDADAIRDELASAGVVLEDTAEGTLWKRQ